MTLFHVFSVGCIGDFVGLVLVDQQPTNRPTATNNNRQETNSDQQ